MSKQSRGQDIVNTGISDLPATNDLLSSFPVHCRPGTRPSSILRKFWNCVQRLDTKAASGTGELGCDWLFPLQHQDARLDAILGDNGRLAGGIVQICRIDQLNIG